MLKSFYIVVAASVVIGLTSCKGNGGDPVDDTFDKEAMLTSISNNAVKPAYKDFIAELSNLKSSLSTFSSSADPSNLSALQEAFLTAYGKWNRCAVYEFGPAADANLRIRLNTFPTDTAQIESNIATGTYDLDLPENSDANGLAAMEYLLFVNESGLINQQTRMDYLSEVFTQLEANSSQIDSDWDAYHSEFTAMTSSGAGSSISNLVNEINFEFELIKNARIGIPLGKKTLGVTQSHKLEAVYAGYSSELAIESLLGIKAAFMGGTGLGLDDYLTQLNATKDGSQLSELIIGLMNEIESDLIGIDLKDKIENSPSDLDEAYNRIEQLVVLLKVDMPSQLGVQITYQDNDGD